MWTVILIHYHFAELRAASASVVLYTTREMDRIYVESSFSSLWIRGLESGVQRLWQDIPHVRKQEMGRPSG